MILDELYQEVILDHNRSPRNFGEVDHADRQADGYNPLCGDKIKVYLRIQDGLIQEIGFKGTGCAISTASASIMTEILKGKTIEEARELFEAFHALVTGRMEGEVDLDTLGQLAAFHGVSGYPVRVKCATLPWHTLKAALDREQQEVSTE